MIFIRKIWAFLRALDLDPGKTQPDPQPRATKHHSSNVWCYTGLYYLVFNEYLNFYIRNWPNFIYQTETGSVKRERESHRLRVWYRYLERERERKTEIEICLTLQLFGQGRHHGFQVGVGDARHEGVQVQGRGGFLVPLWRPRQRKIVKQCKKNLKNQNYVVLYYIKFSYRRQIWPFWGIQPLQCGRNRTYIT